MSHYIRDNELFTRRDKTDTKRFVELEYRKKWS